MASATLIGILVLAGCATTGAGRTPPDVAEAKALNQRFVDAMSSKNLDAAMSCFWNSPDLILVLYGATVRGYESCKAGIAKMFADNDSVKLDVNEVTYVPIGDMWMAVGTATYTLQPKGGATTKLVERWTDLEREIGGKLVYVLDHATIVPE